MVSVLLSSPLLSSPLLSSPLLSSPLLSSPLLPSPPLPSPPLSSLPTCSRINSLFKNCNISPILRPSSSISTEATTSSLRSCRWRCRCRALVLRCSSSLIFTSVSSRAWVDLSSSISSMRFSLPSYILKGVVGGLPGYGEMKVHGSRYIVIGVEGKGHIIDKKGCTRRKFTIAINHTRPKLPTNPRYSIGPIHITHWHAHNLLMTY